MDSYRMVGNRPVPSFYRYSVRHHHYRNSIRESTLAPPQNEFPPLRFRQNNVAENEADQYFHFNLPVTCWGRSLEMSNPANTMVKEIADTGLSQREIQIIRLTAEGLKATELGII